MILKIIKRIGITLIIVGFISLPISPISFTTNKAEANPSYFPPSQYITTPALSNATNTQAFALTSGVSNPTLVFDTYGLGQTSKTDSALLLTQFHASSTSSVLQIGTFYSQDGIDFYDNDYILTNGTSTATTTIGGVQNGYSWQAVSTATSSKAIRIDTPARYIKIVFSVTGANGGVWAQLVPFKQNK